MVKDLHKPLVELPAIQALNLVTKVSAICWTKETILSRFPQLFAGLRRLQGEYVIKLNSNVTPLP